MKLVSFLSTATIFALSTSTAMFAAQSVSAQEPLFTCDSSSGTPTTIVQSPKYGSVKIIEWKTTEFGEKFSPQVRCKTVSEKFQKYAMAGTLKYFTTGTVNRQPVICAVANRNAPCNSESMLYTLKKGSNARTTLKQLLDVRSGSSGGALNETESRIYIDFDKLVEAKAENLEESSNSQIDSTESVYLF
ncbi:MAG: COP23 domain-containing protein [Cyanobacteria bacterium P01_G01_bin.19]